MENMILKTSDGVEYILTPNQYEKSLVWSKSLSSNWDESQTHTFNLSETSEDIDFLI